LSGPDLPPIERLVHLLELAPHPEGGYFRETYRSQRVGPDGRAGSTLIYFLLAPGQVSKLHRIDADEGWHLYLGGPLEIHEFDAARPHESPIVTRLGTDIVHGERPQHVVPAGRWFGVVLAAGAPYALVGCCVAPGFEFEHFELGDRETLVRVFPGAAEAIKRLT
jgi:predicted cupin superfamily sugar epimerase